MCQLDTSLLPPDNVNVGEKIIQLGGVRQWTWHKKWKMAARKGFVTQVLYKLTNLFCSRSQPSPMKKCTLFLISSLSCQFIYFSPCLSKFNVSLHSLCLMTWLVVLKLILAPQFSSWFLVYLTYWVFLQFLGL